MLIYWIAKALFLIVVGAKVPPVKPKDIGQISLSVSRGANRPSTLNPVGGTQG